MLDIRYIYIGTTTADSRLVKIGIAKDVHARWRDIDNSIEKSTERPVAYFKVLNARWLETQLHRKYRYKNKPFKGSGRSEWFALGFFARLWLYVILSVHGIFFTLACVALLASVLITTIMIVL
jgi:hypothetical protein